MPDSVAEAGQEEAIPLQDSKVFPASAAVETAPSTLNPAAAARKSIQRNSSKLSSAVVAAVDAARAVREREQTCKCTSD